MPNNSAVAEGKTGKTDLAWMICGSSSNDMSLKWLPLLQSSLPKIFIGGLEQYIHLM
jgi:hypothetical protein